jgi:hypothetical protein
VSGGGRYRREHDEELTVTYRLSPTEEAKATLDGCAWRCALQREKRVSGDCERRPMRRHVAARWAMPLDKRAR